MKRTILAWVGIISAVALVGIGYVYWQNAMSADRQNTATRQESAQKQTTDMARSDAEIPESSSGLSGVFADYRAESVAASSGTTILFFHAPWCPQCRMIEADIKRQGIPSNVTILKVDYDSNQELRQKYGVTLQTTFIEIDNKGNEIDKFVAYNEPTFDSVKANLLSE